MYAVIVGGRAIIIDPNNADAVVDFLREEQIYEILILLTHEHYDHISGVNWLKNFFKCTVMCSYECGLAIVDPSKNMSRYFNELLKLMNDDKDQLGDTSQNASTNILPYKCVCDNVFHDEINFDYFGLNIKLKETPGHSKGSASIMLDDKIIFTGDNLIYRNPVITRLPGGSKNDFYSQTIPFYESLNASTQVFPGHGEFGLMETLLSKINLMNSQ